MIANAFLAATVICMAIGFWVLQECQFLIPYRLLLWNRYGTAVALFTAALFLNLFAGFYLICRKLFLKDTGQKLAHLEKQLRTGPSISQELSDRLRD